jgi:hypothetical protein
MRWSFDGDPVQCGEVVPSVEADADIFRIRIAQAIIGPHNDNHIGRHTMLKLRQHNWGRAKKCDQQAALNQADAVIREMAGR